MTIQPIADATAANAVKPKIPQSSKIDATVTLREAHVGDWVEMHPFVHVEYATIGDYSYLQEYVTVADSTLGRFCAIAAMTRINAPNHPHRRASQHRFTYVPEYYWSGATRDHAFFADRRAARCAIGNDVWIGHGVTVMPGIVIGDGAIIAAGAVVTKDVAPYTIVGGVPAKVIKERFPRAIAERLQRLAWWTWPPERLQQSVPDFQALDIEAFLEKHAG